MRTKRTLAAMLALSVGMSMTACGGKTGRGNKSNRKGTAGRRSEQ